MTDQEEVKAEAKLRSSASDIRSFMGSGLWTDMKNELLIWIRMNYEFYPSCKTIEEVMKTTGAIQALSRVLQMPQMFVEGLEQDAKKDEVAKEVADV